MKTSITSSYLETLQGADANRILRNCVHCGFCNATCPTYQLTGDELDGPRGRIYLIKQVLEGSPPGRKTQLHLDRCLTCRNCETTCPSGVQYNQLLDIGRAETSRLLQRSLISRIRRNILRKLFLSGGLFTALIQTAQLFRTLLPGTIRSKIPARTGTRLSWPITRHTRKVILLEGCVQPALQPNIDRAAAIVLDKLGIQTLRVPQQSCCGGISHHMDAFDEAHSIMKRNIDAWWPLIEQGDIEAVLSTASGCGVTIKEYGHLLAGDVDYRDKAAAVSRLARDLSEIVAAEDFSLLTSRYEPGRIAYHPPCTLQHGQQVRGTVETILEAAGHSLAPFEDAHLCCGSAGTYSLLQPDLATRLRDNKLGNISGSQPDMIVTANIGCMMHLQSGTQIPVKHWIELYA